jgi:hypothetical protein
MRIRVTTRADLLKRENNSTSIGASKSKMSVRSL